MVTLFRLLLTARVAHGFRRAWSLARNNARTINPTLEACHPFLRVSL